MKNIVLLLIGAFFLIFGLPVGEVKASSYTLTYLINGYQPSGDDQTAYYFQQVAFNVDQTIIPIDLTITYDVTNGEVGTVDITKSLQDAQNLAGGGEKNAKKMKKVKKSC